jgi:exosortase A
MSGYSSSLDAEAPARDISRRRWLTAAAALAAGVLALALVFRPEEAEAVRVWIDSTAYNHCFLVLPVAAYLAWDRRQALAATSPQPVPWLALAALPVALCWLVAERAGIWEARQLLAMSLLQILFLAVLGLRCWRTASAPLLYLFFLVPVGGFLVPFLQSFTVHFMAGGLDVLRIPNYVAGMTIEIPEGAFYVADACAGLRFLVASVAFGVLYGCLMYTSPVRRLVFVALSLVVPVIANGFRALGLVVLAHILGSATAVETDHVLYGWLFFSIVTFALILIGLPFRQTARHPIAAEEGRTSPNLRGPIAVLAGIAAIVVVLSAAAPRLLADRLDDPAVLSPAAADTRFPVPSDCTPAPLPDHPLVKPEMPPPGVAESHAYRCRGGLFVVTLRRYPAHISARPLFDDPLRPQIAWRGSEPAVTRIFDVGGAAQPWRIVEFGRGPRTDGDRYAAVASALWIAGRPAKNAIEGRLRQAVNALSPEAVSPLAAIVTYTAAGGPARGRRALDSFLADTATTSPATGGNSAADARPFNYRR